MKASTFRKWGDSEGYFKFPDWHKPAWKAVYKRWRDCNTEECNDVPNDSMDSEFGEEINAIKG